MKERKGENNGNGAKTKEAKQARKFLSVEKLLMANEEIPTAHRMSNTVQINFEDPELALAGQGSITHHGKGYGALQYFELFGPQQDLILAQVVNLEIYISIKEIHHWISPFLSFSTYSKEIKIVP